MVEISRRRSLQRTLEGNPSPSQVDQHLLDLQLHSGRGHAHLQRQQQPLQAIPQGAQEALQGRLAVVRGVQGEARLEVASLSERVSTLSIVDIRVLGIGRRTSQNP